MSNDKHSKMLERLVYGREATTKLHIENIIWAAVEFPHWRGKELCCETDVILFTGKYYALPYHVLEYKATETHRVEAEKQLAKSENFIKEMFGADCYRWFVWGNLEADVLGDNHPMKDTLKKCGYLMRPRPKYR